MEFILIILAIVAAVSGLFKDKTNTDNPVPERTNNPPKPTPAPSSGSEGDRRSESETRTQTTVPSSSAEESQHEQRKQLAERMNTKQYQDAEDEHTAPIKHKPRKPDTGVSKEQQKLKNSINGKLTKTDVMNGVVMSEVLGQPRAVKPYRSIVAQRKNRH